jgi:hypothetical protein
MGVTDSINGKMRNEYERYWKIWWAEATWIIQMCSRGQDEIKMDVKVFIQLN